MTKFVNILKGSLKNIVSNKLRSLLTILGLVIGIASVIILVGIGNGTSTQVTSQVQSLGADILTLSIQSSDTSLDYSELDDMLRISNIESVAPYKSVSSTVTRGETTSQRANIIATTPDYMDVTNLTISNGRLLSEIDLENNSKVCLLGNDIATTLFSLSNPVGQSIKIDGDNYTVVGVLTAVGSSMGSNVDDTMDSINNTLSLLLGGIASISLIVGGIGVMNVMLVSVTERTKEIGIRKALGAKRIDILVQFLIEALVLCFLGGIIGVATGLGVGTVLGKMGYTFSPSTGIILIALFSSVLIGSVFGLFPANKASKLNPIDALHTD